jgi:hypothetical protein
VLVAAVTAVASVVTPIVVPTVVPTALTHQKTAIATAAIVLANSFPGDKRWFIISHTLLSFVNFQGFSPGLLLPLSFVGL